MNHLTKPRNTSPSEFRNQLLSLNNLLTTIPSTLETDKYSDLDLKYLFVEAMPYLWRTKFQEIGKKARTEPFDELSLFFDFYHFSDNAMTKADVKDTNNNRKPLKQQAGKGGHQLKDDDPCPLHGHHKWIDCYDNKRSPKFRPLTRSPRDDQYFNEVLDSSGQNIQGDHSAPDHNPYDDDY
jgi:hypothetical protein